MDESKDTLTLLPHFLLIKEYLKIAQEEESLLNFYYKSLDAFDRIFSNSEQNFGKFINENKKQVSGRYAYIILQIENALDSFFAHYFILKNGLCNSATSNLRYCYETLLKNYFFLTLPTGEKDLIKYHKIKPWKIRRKLYIPPTSKKYSKKLYEGLSIKSHAGIISSSSFQCCPEVYKDSLGFGIYLLHGYFVFLLECFNQFILEKDREQIKSFLEEFANLFESIPSFIPDKEEIIPLLKFQNIFSVTKSNIENFKRDVEEYLNNS